MKKSKSAVLFAALLLTVFVLTLLCACTPAEKDGVEVIGIAAKDSYPPPSKLRTCISSCPLTVFRPSHFTAERTIRRAFPWICIADAYAAT